MSKTTKVGSNSVTENVLIVNIEDSFTVSNNEIKYFY